MPIKKAYIFATVGTAGDLPGSGNKNTELKHF